jgi:hypothetical protein
MVDSRKESDGVAGPLAYHCRSNIYNARNRLASLEIIRIRRLRDEVAKLVVAQDATDVAEDLVAADSKREQLRHRRSIRREMRATLWKGATKQRHRWRREKLARVKARRPKKSPPRLVVANEAPELEDGFEGEFTEDAREDTPGLRPAWLLPARWAPNSTPALSFGAKRVIPRGSVANLLLSQHHPGGWPCVDREPIDADYPPLINPPDSPPDPSLDASRCQEGGTPW